MTREHGPSDWLPVLGAVAATVGVLVVFVPEGLHLWQIAAGSAAAGGIAWATPLLPESHFGRWVMLLLLWIVAAALIMTGSPALGAPVLCGSAGVRYAIYMTAGERRRWWWLGG